MTGQTGRRAQIAQFLALADMLQASTKIPVTSPAEFHQVTAFIGPTPYFLDTEVSALLAPFVERCSSVTIERFPTGSPLITFEIPQRPSQTLAPGAREALNSEDYTASERINLAQQIIDAATAAYAEQITVEQNRPYPHSSEVGKPGTHPRAVALWWE